MGFQSGCREGPIPVSSLILSYFVGISPLHCCKYRVTDYLMLMGRHTFRLLVLSFFLQLAVILEAV